MTDAWPMIERCMLHQLEPLGPAERVELGLIQRDEPDVTPYIAVSQEWVYDYIPIETPGDDVTYFGLED